MCHFVFLAEEQALRLPETNHKSSHKMHVLGNAWLKGIIEIVYVGDWCSVSCMMQLFNQMFCAAIFKRGI